MKRNTKVTMCWVQVDRRSGRVVTCSKIFKTEGAALSRLAALRRAGRLFDSGPITPVSEEV